MSNYTLVVVDMQGYFPAANDYETVTKVLSEIRKAKRSGLPIVIAEYVGCGPTLPVIVAAAKSEKTVTAQYDENDKSKDIREKLGEKAPSKTFRVCGVNWCACVKATAEGLVKEYPDCDIHIVAKSSNCACGKEKCSLRYTDRFISSEILELAKNPPQKKLKFKKNELIGIIQANPSYIMHLRQTKRLCREAIQENPEVISWVKNQTEELCKLAVTLDPDVIKHVTNPSPELCKLAVEKSGMTIRLLPKKYLTAELCELAVKKLPCCLEYVPEEFITRELCEFAVTSSGSNLRHVPKKFKTQKLCDEANESYGGAINYTPEEFLTEESYINALESHNTSLTDIPVEKLTLAICQRGIKYNGRNIQYVPKEFIDYELCNIAVNDDGRAIEWVPDQFKTPQLIWKAISGSSGGSNLAFVPYEKQSIDMIWYLLGDYEPECLEFCDPKLLTLDVVDSILDMFPRYMKHLPRKYRTTENYMKLLAKDPDYRIAIKEDRLRVERKLSLRGSVSVRSTE